jgi:hypothetical protein
MTLSRTVKSLALMSLLELQAHYPKPDLEEKESSFLQLGIYKQPSKKEGAF